MRRAAWFFAIATVLVSCDCSDRRRAPLPGPYLVESARMANRLGRVLVDSSVNVHYLEVGGLSDAVEMFSLLIVSPTRLSVQTWRNDYDIYTLHALQIEAVLSRPPKKTFWPCAGTMPAVKRVEGEVLMWVFGGTSVIDGVLITLHARGDELGPLLQVGARYLLMARECEDGIHLALPRGVGGMFELAGDRIIASRDWSEFAFEVNARGTVSSLRARLRDVSSAWSLIP